MLSKHFILELSPSPERVCLHIGMYTYKGQRSMFSLIVAHLILLTKDLSLSPEVSDWLDWPLPVSAPTVLRIQIGTTMPSFYVGPGNPNSGPHVY